jgi:hypothetical protein
MKWIGYSEAVAILLMGLVVPAWEQDGVTQSIEKCRKDVVVLESDDAVDLPTAVNLSKQGDEMHVCEGLDKKDWTRYHQLADRFQIAEHLRLQDFLSRHNLWAQFSAEDEAGKR